MYERGSGDQSRSPPPSRQVLSEDRRFARSVPVSSQLVQGDWKPKTWFVSSCCGVRDSSRGLFSTGHHIPRGVRICRVDLLINSESRFGIDPPGHPRSTQHKYSTTPVEVQRPEGDCLWASLFLSNSSCLGSAASRALLRCLDVIEAVLMDSDDEVFSILVDAADLMEATALAAIGLIAPAAVSQAIRRYDGSLPRVGSCRSSWRNPQLYRWICRRRLTVT